MTSVDVRPEHSARAPSPSPVSNIALWTSVLLGPFVFLLNLEVNYAMVDWACNTGHGWALHVVHGVSLLVTIAAAALGVSLWKKTGGSWPDAAQGAVPRARLMAAVGTLGSILIIVSLVAHWVPVWVLGPCPRA